MDIICLWDVARQMMIRVDSLNHSKVKKKNWSMYLMMTVVKLIKSLITKNLKISIGLGFGTTHEGIFCTQLSIFWRASKGHFGT